MLRAFREALQTPELQRKMIFTLLLLAIYRLGSTIPTPGVNAAALQQATSGELFGLLSMVSGGNLTQFSIFALGVLPYITASIVIQLLTKALPPLEKLSKEGEEGRKKISQFTRTAAIVLGAFQALFFSLYIVSNPSLLAIGWDPNFFTVLVMVITQIAGVAMTLWIGERITEVGVGNGISLIIVAGIIGAYPAEIMATLQLFRNEQITLLPLIAFVGVILLTMAGIVAVHTAERRVPITYARARGGAVGNGRRAGQATWLPIKVNQAGVIPVIFASTMMILPNLLASATANSAPQINAFVQTNLVFGTPGYMILESLLIFGFTFLYNSLQFDAKSVSEQLRESGAFVADVRPGAQTAAYLSTISSRLSLWGAIFLVVLTVMPQLVQTMTGITTFMFSGTGLLIIVGVALDTLKQLEAQLTVRRYDGFIRKGKLRSRIDRA